MSRVEKINDAVNLLKKAFYQLGDSARHEDDGKNYYFYFGEKSIELNRGVHSFEIRLFEIVDEDSYKVLGTLKALENGLFYTEGQITEEFLNSRKLFDEETARGLINKLK